MYDLNDHYRQLLQLTEPWTIKDIDLDIPKEQVSIYLEHPRQDDVRCPECNELVPIHDYREQRTWRHLDTM